jgi:hypothetical protein
VAKKKVSPVRKVEARQEEAPKVEAKAPAERFYTSRLSVSHGDRVYPVKDGIVELPAGESWYQDLIRSGALTPCKENKE